MAKKKEEIEIASQTQDYEVVPLGPIRKLERRIEEMEKEKTVSTIERFNERIIDMIELNQHIVDEVVKANQGLREELSSLIGKIDESQKNLNNFLEIIKEAGEKPEGKTDESKVFEKFAEKLLDINQKTVDSNSAILEALSTIDKRLKRIQLGRQLSPNMLARRGFQPTHQAEKRVADTTTENRAKL